MLILPDNFKKAIADPMSTNLQFLCRIALGDDKYLRFAQIGGEYKEEIPIVETYYYDQKDLQIGSITEFINIDKRNHTISELEISFENGKDDSDVIEILGTKQFNTSMIGADIELYVMQTPIKTWTMNIANRAVRIYSGIVSNVSFDNSSDIFTLECRDQIAGILEGEVPYVYDYERIDSKEFKYRPIVYGKRSRVPLIKKYPEDTEGEFYLLGDYREIKQYGLDSPEIHTNYYSPTMTSLENPLLVYLNDYARVPHTIPSEISWWSDLSVGSVPEEQGGESTGQIPSTQYTFDNDGFEFESKYTDVLVDPGGGSLEWELQYRPANLWSNDLIMVFQSLRGVSPTIPYNLSQTSPDTNKLLEFVKPEGGIIQDSSYVWHMPISEDPEFTIEAPITNLELHGLISGTGNQSYENSFGAGTQITDAIPVRTYDDFISSLPMKMYAWNTTRIKTFLAERGYRMPSHRGRSSYSPEDAEVLCNLYHNGNQDYQYLYNNGPIDEALISPIFYYHHGGSRWGATNGHIPQPQKQGVQIIGIHVEKPGAMSNQYFEENGLNLPQAGGRYEWYDILFTDVPQEVRNWFAYGGHYWNTYPLNWHDAYNNNKQYYGPNGDSDFGSSIDPQMLERYGETYDWTQPPFGWCWEYYWLYPQMFSLNNSFMPLGYDGYCDDGQWNPQWSNLNWRMAGSDQWGSGGADWNHFRYNTWYRGGYSHSDGYITGASQLARGATYGPPMAPVNYWGAFAVGGYMMQENGGPLAIETQQLLDALSDSGDGIEIINQTSDNTSSYSISNGWSGGLDITRHTTQFDAFGDQTELIQAEQFEDVNSADEGFVFFRTIKEWSSTEAEAFRPLMQNDLTITGPDMSADLPTLPDNWNALHTFKAIIPPVTPFSPVNNQDPYGEVLYYGHYFPQYSDLRGTDYLLNLYSKGQTNNYDDLTYFTISDNETTRTIARINLELEGTTIKPAPESSLRKVFNLSEDEPVKNVMNLMTGELVWQLYPNVEGQNAPQDDDNFVLKIGVCNRDDQVGFDVNTTPANGFNYGENYGISLASDELLQDQLVAWDYDTGTFTQMFIDAYVEGLCDINIAKLQWGNLYVKQYVIAGGAHKASYYADTIGRVSTNEYNPLGINLGSIISNPAHVIADLSYEMGVAIEDFDQEAFQVMQNENNNIKMGFAVFENITLSKLFEDMCKSTMSIPFYKVSSGQYSAFTLRKTLTDANVDKTIEADTVINFNYMQSEYESLASRFIVEYDYDYKTKDYKKQTPVREVIDLLPNYDPTYYKKDVLKVVKSKFISGSGTSAMYLRDYYARYYCNIHLIIEFTVPYSVGIELEVGDVIKFNKLLGNKKAFGKDYTDNGNDDDKSLNGTDLFTNFTIYKITKSQNDITIECQQNHALSNQSINPSINPTYTEDASGVDDYVDPGDVDPEGEYGQDWIDSMDIKYGILWRNIYYPGTSQLADNAFIFNLMEFWNIGNYVLFPVDLFEEMTGFTDNDDPQYLFANGDLNGDGIFNIQDMITLVGLIIGTTPPGNYTYGDINLDQTEDILDVVAGVNYVLGGN